MSVVATCGARPVVLVTGASRGIGAHLALSFGGAGYDLAVTARSVDDLAGVHREMVDGSGESGGTVLPLALEVTDRDSVEHAVDAVVRRFGRLDVLVHNAGIIEPESVLWESDPDRWWRVMEVNVKGAYLVSRAVTRRMVDAGGGRVIMLNSGSGGKDSADLSAYHASKSALARITNAIVLAGRPHGVLAFDLAPGVVRTDMTRSMVMHEGRSEWTDPAQVGRLAVALASGRLDAWAGRMVRAGADTVESLEQRSVMPLDDDVRRLRWVSYGPGDPVLP